MSHERFIEVAENNYPMIGEDAVVQALDYPRSGYFITTSLYWDCECEDNYIRRSDQLMCEECGEFQEDAPNSRINELRRHGFHIDWTQPEWRASLSEHNATFRKRQPITNRQMRQ